MVATHSSMLPLGTPAPTFNLKDVVSGNMVSLQKNDTANGYLVAFICNHCPFVIHLREHLPANFNEIQDKGIEIFAISSNDIVNYPQDSPEKMKEFSEFHGFKFPYLYDEKQDVASAYTAACTPDFFLFDKDLKLFYRGRYDATRPGSEAQITGEDLLGAIDCLLEESVPPKDQFPSIGCNIKWQVGQEPSYFKKKS